MTGASFLSKFLGMIYVIPFHALVGETGGTLFSFAYTPYSIFISISTIGVPLAVSKFVAKYNSLEDYRTGMRMFKAGISLMALTGFLAFLILFFSAEKLATGMITSKNPDHITVSDVTYVIRMVSFALILIPSMSIVRGFFQGYNSMGPTAVSQVIEQIVRIIFLLGGSVVILKVFDGTITTAVGFSTFSAFIGALASCLVLYIYWLKRKPHLMQLQEQQKTTHDVSLKELFIELFRYAGPFVLVGLAIPLYQLIDQFTFERAMVAIGKDDIWEYAYAAINFYGHKIVIIPITLATGLSIATLPALTKSFTENNRKLLKQQINQAIQIILLLVIPAVVGLVMLSDEAYGSLYGLDNIEVTGTLLAWYAPVALLFALFSVTSSILQGINEQRFAVIHLLAGLLLKVLFNIQLIHTFGAKGAIFGTAIAAGTAVSLNLWRIKRSIYFSYKQILKRTALIVIFTIIMAVTIVILKIIFG
ncbi:MAG TPA: polysaccharide biosynthesis protein, partial [Bacillota bacterium]